MHLEVEVRRQQLTVLVLALLVVIVVRGAGAVFVAVAGGGFRSGQTLQPLALFAQASAAVSNSADSARPWRFAQYLCLIQP